MKLVMAGRLQPCFLLTYACPVQALKTLLPKPLEPVEHDGLGFMDIVVCRVAGMRPVPMPAALGLNFRLVAYRVRVRFDLRSGETLQGLYFLRSDVNRRFVWRLGNWLTDFRFRATRVDFRQGAESFEFQVHAREAAASGVFRLLAPEATGIARRSAPGGWAAALGDYEPVAIALDSVQGEVRLAPVRRPSSQWRPEPVKLEKARWALLESWLAHPPVLVSARMVPAVDYRWELGERLRPD